MIREEGPLRELLDRLRSTGIDRQARGIALERLAAQLFRRAHYRVEIDAGIARPRQTDLLAMTSHEAYLVEAKWRAKRAGVDAVDDLRSRLARTPPNVIGVLISVSGFSARAVEEVRRNRKRPVLLLGAEELEQATELHGDLRRMMQLKRDALLIDGEVHLLAQPPTRKQRRRAQVDVAELGAGTSIVFPDGTRSPWACSRGGFGPFVFARTLRDPDTGPWGAGVTVDLPFRLDDAADVIWALSELAALGWATRGGHWCIQQAEQNWHGIGVASLCDGLREWQLRYRDAGRIHHTEEVSYYDFCEDRYFVLTVDIDASERRQARYATLSMQLAGVPLDQDPIRELCRTFDVTARVHFLPRPEQSVETTFAERIPVDPVAFIVEKDAEAPRSEEWVTGLVIRNPYYGSRKAGDDSAQLPPHLAESELAVCDLRSWHPLDEPRIGYHLRGLSWAWTSHAVVIRLTADWPDDPKRLSRTGDVSPKRRR